MTDDTRVDTMGIGRTTPGGLTTQYYGLNHPNPTSMRAQGTSHGGHLDYIRWQGMSAEDVRRMYQPGSGGEDTTGHVHPTLDATGRFISGPHSSTSPLYDIQPVRTDLTLEKIVRQQLSYLTSGKIQDIISSLNDICTDDDDSAFNDGVSQALVICVDALQDFSSEQGLLESRMSSLSDREEAVRKMEEEVRTAHAARPRLASFARHAPINFRDLHENPKRVVGSIASAFVDSVRHEILRSNDVNARMVLDLEEYIRDATIGMAQVTNCRATIHPDHLDNITQRGARIVLEVEFSVCNHDPTRAPLASLVRIGVASDISYRDRYV